jgi:hypothetical protein
MKKMMKNVLFIFVATIVISLGLYLGDFVDLVQYAGDYAWLVLPLTALPPAVVLWFVQKKLRIRELG